MMIRKNGRFPQSFLFLIAAIMLAAGFAADYYVTAAQHAPQITHTYIVLLDGASVVGKLAQTQSPEMNLTGLSAQLAQRSVQAQQEAAIAKMEKVVERPLSISHQYTIVLNGMAVELTEAEAVEIAAQPGIKAVVPNQVQMPQTDSGPNWIGASQLWDGSQTGGIAGTQGEGIIIGIIDTGINLDHPSFAAVGGDGYVHTNPKGAGNYLGHCATQPGISVCNDKLIGAYSWPDVGDNPEDDWGGVGGGHGSNVAGIAAGNVISAAFTAPTTVLTTTLSGVAPHANIIAYDICKPGVGCPNDIALAAVQQAILDGVDVLNYSIGGSPSDPWQNPVALAFLDAREAGIFVATSAGNSGPGAGTILSPGNSPWMTSVANTTHNGRFDNTLTSLSGGDTTLPSPIIGSSITGGHGPAPIVAALGVTNTLGTPDNGTCQANFAAGTWLAGEIVLCRGGGSATTKANRVLAGGSGGVVIDTGHNVSQIMGIERLPLPGMNIKLADADVLAAWLAAGSNHMAEIQGTIRQHDPGYADELYFQSSRGPAQFMTDVLKPNVGAPGVLIWSAGLSTGSTTPPEWSFYRGTSQASPHVAGAAALLTVLHPDWTPAEIESALMMTAVTTVTENDGSPADPFGQGAGRVELTAVSRAGLVLNETADGFRAADPALDGLPNALNLASLTAENCAPRCTWTRTFRNTLDKPATWTLTNTDSSQVWVDIEPSTFTIPAHSQQTISVTAYHACWQASAWKFTALLLQEEGGLSPDLHLPLTVSGSCQATFLPVVMQSK
ncbi:MAG: S8 family serine peptidase [Anaerolineae bacterium]|nr:S8 family serine peptidase [Anaerolineae bacterium]